MFVRFIEQLKIRLQQPLPGEEVQLKMAPSGRGSIRFYPSFLFKPKKSAVLILLYPHQEIIQTVFIVRPIYNGVHSGQIAFPGGKFDKNDKDLKHTALRETHEEIGIASENIEIIGNLTDVYINPSNFLVTPYIGFTNELPQFIKNDKEVDKVLTYNVFELNDESIRSEKKIKLSLGLEVMAPYYDIDGLTLWGATAMMVSELNKVIEEAKGIIL